MADNNAAEGSFLQPKATFSISGEDLAKTPENEDRSDSNDGPPRSRSRFKVAKVEFVNDKPETSLLEDEPAKSPHGDPTKSPPTTSAPPKFIINSPGELKRNRLESVCSTDTDVPYSPTDFTYSQTYDTRNLKTFGRNTLETLPHLDHYRNLLSATGAMRKRPTLLELHEQDKADQAESEFKTPKDAENGQVHISEPLEDVKAVTNPVQGLKFGWVKGVLVRCLLNIWGVMLFLRLSWVVGQAGIGLAILIILLSGAVTVFTALSMSAICTNGEVKGGGAYYMISRSLGPEFGGAIGLIFSVANAVAIAMYVVGFAETIRDILKAHDCLMVDELNDVRIIGVVTAVVLLGIALIGMAWEARAQIILLVILLIAIANFIIGTFIPPSEAKVSQGFVGYEVSITKSNFEPDFRDGEDFFSVFSIFFPAATGILAGANISGDLADAQSAIPKGTFLAIVISSITYIIMAILVGLVMVRDASGVVLTAGNATHMAANGTLSGLTSNHTTIVTLSSNCTAGVDCTYGLLNDMQVMQLVSAWGPIIIAGIISATLSSALASIVSAPKVFQAVCKDKIFPGIHIFAKGYGPSDEPRLAYLLASLIGVGCICIGELNAIAPLISNFFLMSYALINYSCFDASLAKSPGWRPAFRFYNMWLSLIGAVLCLAVMFIINWWTALITFTLVAIIYLYVHYRKPEINWGSSMQAHVYRNSLHSTIKLINVEEHVKNFRPQILVMSGFPSERPALVDFAASLTKNVSLMVCGHILRLDAGDSLLDPRSIVRDAYKWLAKRRIKAFYSPVMASSFRQGLQALLQCAGTGKLRPNTLLLGFKSNWQTSLPIEVEEYFQIIHDAFDLHFGVGILRLSEGLHTSYQPTMEDSQLDDEALRWTRVLAKCSNNADYSPGASPGASPLGSTQTAPVAYDEDEEDDDDDTDNGISMKPVMETGTLSEVEPLKVNTAKKQVKFVNGRKTSAMPSENDQEGEDNEVAVLPYPGSPAHDLSKDLQDRFRHKQKKGCIDVWWLFDDGGLTLLLPYILTTKSQWAGCKLRVFSAGTKRGELQREQRHMATLLSKFRIDCQEMTILTDVGKRPSEDSYNAFKTLISGYMLQDGETEESHPWKISTSELSVQKDKTMRHIRLHELLLQHSSESRLIVMTLPMPKKGLCSSGLYMAWIDTLTRDLPPILLLRGNQESVLTYYS